MPGRKTRNAGRFGSARNDSASTPAQPASPVRPARLPRCPAGRSPCGGRPPLRQHPRLAVPGRLQESRLARAARPARLRAFGRRPARRDAHTCWPAPSSRVGPVRPATRRSTTGRRGQPEVREVDRVHGRRRVVGRIDGLVAAEVLQPLDQRPGIWGVQATVQKPRLPGFRPARDRGVVQFLAHRSTPESTSRPSTHADGPRDLVHHSDRSSRQPQPAWRGGPAEGSAPAETREIE